MRGIRTVLPPAFLTGDLVITPFTEESLELKALSVFGESLSQIPITDLEEYRKRTEREVLGYYIPYFRSRKFWLKAIHYFVNKVNIRYSIHTLVQKNKLYGSTQLYEMGTLGILIRSIDKVERIKNITAGATSETLFKEPIQDSYMDLFNYAILAVLVIDKRL